MAARRRVKALDAEHSEVIKITRKAKFQVDTEERQPKPIQAKNLKQAEYIKAIHRGELVIGIGPAGVGKSFIAASIAADYLRQGKVQKVILTRPNMALGKSIGFFPGDLNEKMSNWLLPLTSTMRSRMGRKENGAAFDIALKNGDIEFVPFETLRGRSFDNCFVILDEAQNTTVAEMKAFVTRLGEGSTTIIDGDLNQRDVPGESGLGNLISLIRKEGMDVPIVEFGLEDIVRSDLCAQFVRAYMKAGI